MSAGQATPGGRLAVRVLEDRNLPAAITSRMCALRIAQESDASWATGAPHSSSLVWDHEQQFEMLVFNPVGPLSLTLSHTAEGSLSSSVGPALCRLDLPLFHFANSEHTDWHTLISPKTGEKVGEIRLEVQYKCTPAWTELYTGLKFHHDKIFDSAIKHLTRALNLGKEFEDDTVLALRAARSAAHLALRQYDEALDDAEAAVQANPNAVDGYYCQAMVYSQTGLLAEALRVVETGLDINDESPLLLQLQQQMRSELAKGPPSAEAVQGREDYERKDFRAAVESFSKAISQQPTNALVLVNRALSHLAAGQLLEAHADILKAGQMSPAWVFEQPIIKQGVVRKSGSWNMVLRYRYFVLKYNFLFYFDNPPVAADSSTRLQPNGVIIVQRGKTDVTQMRGENRKHIEITSLTSRVYRLKCANEAEGDEWRTTLQAVPAEFPLPENRAEIRGRWRPGTRDGSSSSSSSSSASSVVGGSSQVDDGRRDQRSGLSSSSAAGEIKPVVLNSPVIYGYVMAKGKRQPKKWWCTVLESDASFYMFRQKPQMRGEGPVQPDKAIRLPTTKIATASPTELQLATSTKTYTLQFASDADLKPWIQALQAAASPLAGPSSPTSHRPHSPGPSTPTAPLSPSEERIFRSYGLSHPMISL